MDGAPRDSRVRGGFRDSIVLRRRHGEPGGDHLSRHSPLIVVRRLAADVGGVAANLEGRTAMALIRGDSSPRHSN